MKTSIEFDEFVAKTMFERGHNGTTADLGIESARLYHDSGWWRYDRLMDQIVTEADRMAERLERVAASAKRGNRPNCLGELQSAGVQFDILCGRVTECHDGAVQHVWHMIDTAVRGLGGGR